MTQIQECRGGCKGTHPTICEQEGCAIVQGEYRRAKKEARKIVLKTKHNKSFQGRAAFRQPLNSGIKLEPQRSDEMEREYEFEVWQDDEWQAGGNTATPDAALAEARHYEMMYSKDGPVTVRFYVKQKISIIELELEIEAAARHESAKATSILYADDDARDPTRGGSSCEASMLRDALTDLRDRIRAHPAYADLTEGEEIDMGGDTAELSYIARMADAAIGT